MKRKRSFIIIAMAAIVLVSLCAVSANTSASAADSGSSRASVNASPDLVGNPIPATTSPSVCIPKFLPYCYLFVQGYDGALWYNRQVDYTNDSSSTNWGWGGWQSLGGVLTSSPCAVSRSPDALDVYVRGTDGAIWQRTTTNNGTSWSNWISLGGQVAPGTGPGASGWANREDVFVRATDGALWQKTWTGTWSSWQSLGGKLTSSPAAVSRGTGLIDVCVRGTDGAVWLKSYNNGWSGWSGVGGALASGTGPAIGAWRADRSSSWGSYMDRLDVFVHGTDAAVWQNMDRRVWVVQLERPRREADIVTDSSNAEVLHLSLGARHGRLHLPRRVLRVVVRLDGRHHARSSRIILAGLAPLHQRVLQPGVEHSMNTECKGLRNA